MIVGTCRDFSAATNDGGEVRFFYGLYFKVGTCGLFGRKDDFILVIALFLMRVGCMQIAIFAGLMIVVVCRFVLMVVVMGTTEKCCCAYSK